MALGEVQGELEGRRSGEVGCQTGGARAGCPGLWEKPEMKPFCSWDLHQGSPVTDGRDGRLSQR